MKKFEMLSALTKWDDNQKIYQLVFHLIKSALAWYGSLEEAKQNNWTHLKNEFKKQYIDNIPSLVVEQQISVRKLEPGESVQDYYSSLISLGGKVGKKPSDLATQFLKGLPEACREYCY